MVEYLLRKVVNVLVYLFFLSATVYSLVAPSPREGDKSNGNTFITPSYWIEYIWSLIHLLLGGFVIYQWFDMAHDAAIVGVSWYFVSSVLLNAAWLALLKTHHYILGFLVGLLTAASVSCIYYKLKKDPNTDTSLWDKLWVQMPFSLWHGWVVYSVVLNFFQMFPTFRDSVVPNVWHRIAVIAALLFLTSTAISYVEFEKQRGDVAGAVVIGLGLLAIFTHQHDPYIRWTALGTGLLSLLYPLRILLIRLTGRRHAEQAPLLG